jgi:hypothetical protein
MNGAMGVSAENADASFVKDTVSGGFEVLFDFWCVDQRLCRSLYQSQLTQWGSQAEACATAA